MEMSRFSKYYSSCGNIPLDAYSRNKYYKDSNYFSGGLWGENGDEAAGSVSSSAIGVIWQIVLGIINAIMGALISSLFLIRKLRPHLKLEIIDLSHNYTDGFNQHFLFEFILKNVGDRATTINAIELTAIDNKQVKVKASNIIELIPRDTEKWARLDAHDSLRLKVYFRCPYNGAAEEKIKCIFTFFHTYGSRKIKHLSQYDKKQPLIPSTSNFGIV